MKTTSHHIFRLTLCLLIGFAAVCSFAQTNYVGISSSLTAQIAKDTEAAAKLKDKTLAVMCFVNKSADEEVDPAILQVKLITAMVRAKICRVLERGQLGKALEEMKLNAGGLVSAEDQKRLGNLLGASFLLIGTISGEAGAISVDAGIFDTETGETLVAADYADAGAAPPAGGPKPSVIRSEMSMIWCGASEMMVMSDAEAAAQAKLDTVIWVVEEKILGDANDISLLWQPELKKRIYRQPERYIKSVQAREEGYFLTVNLAYLMRDLTAVIFGKVTPRIAIDTREEIIARPVSDPAVQSTIAKTLLGYGFRVTDSVQAHAMLSREAVRQAVYNENPAALNIIDEVAGELGADMLAIGDSFAEQRTDRAGFDARIEYHVVIPATADWLAAVQETYSITRASGMNVDLNSAVCGKLALQKGAELTALRLGSAMLKAYGKPVYRVRIWKVPNFQANEKIIAGLKQQLPGAIITGETLNVLGKDLNAHYATYSISTKRPADDIANALEALTGVKVRVTIKECRSVVGEIW